MNGHSQPSEANHVDQPPTNVSSGIAPVAPFVPDNHTDANSLFGDSDYGAATVSTTETAAAAVSKESEPVFTAPPANMTADTQPPSDMALRTQQDQSPAVQLAPASSSAPAAGADRKSTRLNSSHWE